MARTLPTPMVIMLNVHPSRQGDLVGVEEITTAPYTPITYYRDSFGNICGRLVAPPGGVVFPAARVVRDSGLPDAVVPTAQQLPIEQLPDDCLVYLMGSRYCETDKLTDLAWSLFKDTKPGWERVQAICDYVHNHLTFGYHFAAPTKSAHSVHEERQRRLPRLRASRGHAVPLHEYPDPLLHRLSRRYRRAAG